MNNRPFIGVGVLILNKNNQLLLGKRKASHGMHTWSAPGGHLEFGESFEDCAKREVLEETGLDIEAPQYLAVTNDFFEKENKHYVTILMIVHYPENQIVQNCEPHKTEKWEWYELDDLPQPLFMSIDKLIAGKSYGRKWEEFQESHKQ